MMIEKRTRAVGKRNEHVGRMSPELDPEKLALGL
jgi:hypothetical protein